MTRILVPGETCAAPLLRWPDGGLLIDGRDYYRAVYQALIQARRRVLIAAWQVDSDVTLLRGDDRRGARYPVTLLPLLVALCAERPELEVHVLVWDASTLFVFERELRQAETFASSGHPRIRFVADGCHPIGGSHHQKLIVVDRGIAFLGGMDVCVSRWDDRIHAAEDGRRANRLGWGHHPYHDVQAWVRGEAVDLVTAEFSDRWWRATGERPRLADVDARPVAFEPTLTVTAPVAALTRTRPPMLDPPGAPVTELRALHVRAIAAAERGIYLENQYYSSEDVHAALLERLRRPARPPLEVVMILPERASALKEHISLGIRQGNLIRELARVAARHGHRFGAYHAVAPRAGGGEVPVYVHAKVLVVDDRLVLVSSANTTNRSMGLDTELGLAWEAPAPTPSLQAVRLELLREHTGLPPQRARAVLGPIAGLVGRLDGLVVARRGRLRVLPMAAPNGRGLLDRLLPAGILIDPRRPLLDDALAATEANGESGWLARISGMLRARRRRRTWPSRSSSSSA